MTMPEHYPQLPIESRGVQADNIRLSSVLG